MSNNTSQPELVDAVKRRDWDKARALLRRNNAQDLVEYTYYNQNALCYACEYKAPSDIIQLMINTSEKAPLEQNKKGLTPLHHAILWSSEDIIIMLLEACPRAASISDNDGMTPLHWAIAQNRSSTVICHLLAANPTAATATNKKRNTSLCFLFRKWNMTLRNSLDCINGDGDMNEFDNVILRHGSTEKRVGELHQTFLLLLQAVTYGSIKENQESPFRPLCEAIINPRCPWSIVKLILILDPKKASQWNREEKLPIHVAAAATSSSDGEFYHCSNCNSRMLNLSWFQSKGNWYIKYCQSCFKKAGYEAIKEEFSLMKSVDKIPTVIGDLLATNSKFAEIPDCEGRLPLHIAIENEKPFDKGLKAILLAAPKGLNTRDIKTHLYPFMLTATKHETKTNTLEKFTLCYAMLTENPVHVSSGIPH